MTFRLGYGTNGFANHRLDDALAVIADLGYTAVALTLDHHHLDPFGEDVSRHTARIAARLAELDLRVVVETGARYLLNPYRKHHPTLVSEEQDVRVDFLIRATRIAADLGADCVSFWSGTGDSWDLLKAGVTKVLDGTHDVALALEPEPGMLVERLADALRLRTELGDPDRLRITLDVGHCVAVEPQDAATCIRQAGDLLVNVQLDDMLPGVHEHLEFGEGRLDLAGTLGALIDIGYSGVAAVELPRHGHAAPEVARRSLDALWAARWLAHAERTVRDDPGSVQRFFSAAGRETRFGADDARVRLVVAYAEASPDVAEGLTALYRGGSSAERRAVLRALADAGGKAQEAGLALVKDALRANETGLVTAALGAFAGRHLDQHSWRHGVLKCLFMGVPLDVVAGLEQRTDPELLRMVAAFAEERRAAGRPIPDDALALLGKAS